MPADLFEELREYSGCTSISDLLSGRFNKRAREYLKTVDCNDWALTVLDDISMYIYGENTTFQKAEEAEIFFMKGKF